MSDLIEQLKELTGRLELLSSGVGLGLQDRQLLRNVLAHIRELDAIEAATIERCAQIVVEWMGECVAADRIRALKPSGDPVPAHRRAADYCD